jgi:8-oxo-dGTP pyrophosphatase MutT (NUDIX family)
MESFGPGNYMVVVLHVGGSKAFDINLVSVREPRTGRTWFHASSILCNEEHVDAAVRELFEETCLTSIVDNLTMLSNNPVRMSLPEGKHHLAYVVSAFVPVPYVTSNLRAPSKVSQVVVAQSTISRWYLRRSKID